MPYIDKDSRDKLDSVISELAFTIANEDLTAGDLNYIITSILHMYIREKGLRYGNINTVVGVLDCAKMELYRKLAAPYEDEKINENGDMNIL